MIILIMYIKNKILASIYYITILIKFINVIYNSKKIFQFRTIYINNILCNII